MPECDRCGESDSLAFSCNHCSGTFCSEHRLPENHQCLGLRSKAGETKPLESGGPSTDRRGTKRKQREWVRKKETKKTERRRPAVDPKPKRDLDRSESTTSTQVAPNTEPANGAKYGRSLKPNEGTSEYGHRWAGAGGEGQAAIRQGVDTVLGLLILIFLYPLQLLRRHPVVIAGLCFLLAGSIAFGPVQTAPYLPGEYGSAIDDRLKGTGDDIDAAAVGFVNTTSNVAQQAANSTRGESLEAAEVEGYAHKYVNAERSSRGLNNLSYDSELAEIARSHSEDMAERGYFSHESPSGETMGGRYDRFGYDCRVPIGGGAYRTGGENIAQTYYQESLISGDYYSTPRELARGVVNQWMDSPGHRENILTEEWRAEGLGVAIVETDDGTAVYVTQNFC